MKISQQGQKELELTPAIPGDVSSFDVSNDSIRDLFLVLDFSQNSDNVYIKFLNDREAIVVEKTRSEMII